MIMAIISDVHGNYPALKSVLDKIDEMGCDRIISLGDVVGYYCMVNECVDEFRKRNVINILGNHESYLLGINNCYRSLTVRNCIEYQKKIITEENLIYLKKSLMSYDSDVISARHGGWRDPLEEYIDKFDFSIQQDDRIYCSGHTHVQVIQAKSGKTYFNPGAVGQPRDGNPKAAFAIIRDRKVELYRVEYAIEDIVMQMRRVGFEDRISNCLFDGRKIETYRK
ncbi:metallophosphoesterase family protein [Butyrivibrio sp. FCS006]|uniref:metallophosphoesterase family protein n=1 Tax=Butyrivibrio sp. FCS006 TaxID=1280684 RepID=UPI00041119EC|nr:metallophosphoesterase family protein [Butyrivibrio sp. FCS006]